LKYIILYGSESELIKELYRPGDGLVLVRVYGSNPPPTNNGCINIDGRSNSLVADILNVVSEAKKGDQIIFIGAAFLSDNALLVSLKAEEVDLLLALNVISYVRLVSSLLPIMVRIRSGNFIYLSSFRANNPTKGAIIYSASKAFGETFFIGVAREYGRFGVTCNALRMGYFDGRILSSLGGDEAIDKVKRRSAIRRLGSADDLRKAILFCIDSPYATGGILEINGALDFE
jgi:NAD(P)-dependent dehydrogenase (short-subunit alcohol dehydrogenase family)